MTRIEEARALARRARRAAAKIAAAPTARKDAVLRRIADSLRGDAAGAVLWANEADLAAATSLDTAMRDRLRLDPARLEEVARAVDAVRALPDPVGRIDALVPQPSGLLVGRMAVPLGVVLMVYESRPNVTVDAAVLCLKAGNAVVLRGGSEASRTNLALAAVVRDALDAEDLPSDAVVAVEDPDRELLYALLACEGDIDVAVPRGGTGLIRAVADHARVPVIRHWQGICHVFVHGDADLDVAERIVVNAKVQRPGVCNAMETLLVDRAVAAEAIPRLFAALRRHQVEIRACPDSLALSGDLSGARPAVEADYDTEFLSLICACRVVDGLDDAIAFIADHGSRHTASIVTRDHAASMRFLREVDASCVLVNASTRFNDGGELGLGAELGISTTKLHAYGPMGLAELCTRKFVVFGQGQTRGAVP